MKLKMNPKEARKLILKALNMIEIDAFDNRCAFYRRNSYEYDLFICHLFIYVEDTGILSEFATHIFDHRDYEDFRRVGCAWASVHDSSRKEDNEVRILILCFLLQLVEEEF